jgi:hypothetical protein
VADSELDLLTISPSIHAEFFIYHMFIHVHTLHRVIYIEMREQDREKKEKGGRTHGVPPLDRWVPTCTEVSH